MELRQSNLDLMDRQTILPTGGARQRRYLIGVGSNIAPRVNVPKALEILRTQAQKCISSRAIETEPVGMVSEHTFCNLVLYIEIDLDPIALKTWFNTIEGTMGRDRSDPNCKIKDRPIDLDILKEIHSVDDYYEALIESPDYCRSILHELLGSLLYPAPQTADDGLALSIGNLQFGTTPRDISALNVTCA